MNLGCEKYTIHFLTQTVVNRRQNLNQIDKLISGDGCNLKPAKNK